MQTQDSIQHQEVQSYEDLRAPVFDIKNEQYLYKTAQTLQVDKFQATNNNLKDQSVLNMLKASDKQIQWSPQGTFLILIKPDKVFFLGGKEMTPII